MCLYRYRFVLACLLTPITPALSASPDKTVLGIELAAPFAVPACSAREVSISRRICFNAGMIDRKAWGAEEYYVSIPSAGTPPHVRGELRVSVVKGVVESIQVSTWGIQAQGGALAALTRQYGEPARTRREMHHALRSRFPTQYAEWDFDDFTVKLDGTTGSIDWGRIEVTMRRYQRLVSDHGAGVSK
ncbi:MAG: hypothetical protein ACT4P8_01630 [Betaproteobacteria bacterium]